MESFRGKVSRDGTPYFKFVVTDGSRGVTIFAIGRSTCRDGMRATVEGMFEKGNRLGRRTVYQVIVATPVTCR